MVEPAQSVLLTTAEAAKRLRLSAITLHRWRLQGDGPAFIALGRKVFYRPGDLDTYLNELATRPGTRKATVSIPLKSGPLPALQSSAPIPTPALPPVDTSPPFDVADDSAQRGPADERLARIRALKREQPSLSGYAIAAEVGCSEATVRRALKRLNREATE